MNSYIVKENYLKWKLDLGKQRDRAERQTGRSKQKEIVPKVDVPKRLMATQVLLDPRLEPAIRLTSDTTLVERKSCKTLISS